MGFKCSSKLEVGRKIKAFKSNPENIENFKKMEAFMVSAIVLSAGKGTRMKTNVAKQYLELNGKPVLYYSLKAFEESLVDEIVVVAGKNDMAYVKDQIVNKFGFNKVVSVVSGGEYRFSSVYNGLRALKENTECVFIHDGARPLVTAEMIEHLYNAVKDKMAVIAAAPAKDTVKVVDSDGKVLSTPSRDSLVMVQTPQVFEYNLVKTAYDKLMASGNTDVTDDAMVVELYADAEVYSVNTGYGNIKITTPEDMFIAEKLLESTQQ